MRPPRNEEPIAIVAMAGIFPRAADARAFWRNIVAKVDGVDHAPADWGAAPLLDPTSKANDRIYTDKGGFLGDLAVFDPLRHGVMPSSVDGGEPDQFLALQVAADAVEDLALGITPAEGDRVAVILGRGTYINRGFTTVVQHGIMVDRLLDILSQLHPDTPPETLAELKSRLKDTLPPFNPGMAPALVPNLVAGRVANRLDFRGANYIIDAACASSLIAVERGMADLRAGRIDMAVVGGIQASTPPPIYQIFCQLEALSKKGMIRPFSEGADGTLLAEGVGILCIKRLSDAEAAGDRIYALIRAIGVASDGKGLSILAPRPEGEELALERAYDEAGVNPGTVGLIEAHGTATSVGDATEVGALAAQFGPRRGKAADIALGSVKSMIGHCLPASGSAGLIKAAYALHHRVLPPMLLDTPNPALGIEKTRFYLNTEARPWVHGLDSPRRAGVNAFGFGGINAHAILEEYIPPPARALADMLPPVSADPAPAINRPSEIFLLSAPGAAGLQAELGSLGAELAAPGADLSRIARERARGLLAQGDWRIGLVARTLAEAQAHLHRAAEALAAGKARLRDRKGVYLGTTPMGGKLAFLFPGEGSQSAGMLRDLMLHVPQMRGWFDLAEQAFADHPRQLGPTQALIAAETASEALWRMDIGPELIFAANQSVAELYRLLDLRPDMLAGHSTGEYSALYAAGCTRRDSRRVLVGEMRALNALYERLERDGAIAEGSLITMGAVDRIALQGRIAGRSDLFVAMDNCPNQQVLAATTEKARDDALAMASEMGGLADALPFARAYHSPAFAPFAKALRTFLDGIDIASPALPVYSCMTAAPFPADPASIRDLAAGQWGAAVRFTETVQRMHDDGARVFVECGPRNNLTAFVSDILRERPHLALAADTPGRGGLEQVHHMAAQLWTAGIDLNPTALVPPETPEPVRGRKPTVLKMGLQPMRLRSVEGLVTAPARAEGLAPPPAAVAPAPPAPSAPQPTAIDGWMEMMDRFLSHERDLMTAFLAPRAAPAAEAARPALAPAGERLCLLDSTAPRPDGRGLTARLTIDPARMPYLGDHSFGRALSQRDPALTGLSVVPLTFSIEALAQAAAALCPDLVVTAVTELRASRWLALDAGPLELELDAELRSREASAARVHVRLREAPRPGGPALRPILIEAGVELAPNFAPAPAAAIAPIAPVSARIDPGMARLWDRSAVYERIMFHGPALQAVAAMDLATADQVSGILDGMPAGGLLARTAAPLFETDPVTMDAVGQLVGVWAAQMLPEAFHIFPFRMERLDIFRPALAAGAAARCTGHVALIGADEIRSDLEVVGADGRLACRITGWWDKRFVLPDAFFRARLDPARNPLGRKVTFPGLPDGIALALVEGPDQALLDGSGGIWEKVLAHLILSAEERAGTWHGRPNSGGPALPQASAARRQDWLRGRAAVKDAVRFLAGRPVCPADIVVTAETDSGRPVLSSHPAGPWPTGQPPVSISHAAHYALAGAADPSRFSGLGVDMEPIRPWDANFARTAFPPAEAARLEEIPAGAARDRAMTRLWCIREAGAKTLGLGLEAAIGRFDVLSDPALPGPAQLADRTGAPAPQIVTSDARSVDGLEIILAVGHLPTVNFA